MVGIFVYWYCYDEAADGHTLVTLPQLMTWNQCETWPNFKVAPFMDMKFDAGACSYFKAGKVKAGYVKGRSSSDTAGKGFA